MWPHPDRLADALRGPHQILTGVEWSADWTTWHTVRAPVTVGVTQDRTAAARWALTAQVPTGSVPLGVEGLHEFGCRIRVWIGVQGLRMDPVWLPYGRYRVDSIGRAEPSPTIPVVGKSLESALADAEFPRLRSMPDQPMDTKLTQLERLVREAVPDAVFLWDAEVQAQAASPMPLVAEDKDRAALTVATGKLSIPASVGAELSTDAAGTWRVRRTPTLADEPVWTYDRGAGGVLVDTEARSAAKIKNVWAATGQLADSQTVIGPAYAWDSDPTSLTYAGPDPVASPQLAGRYGVRVGRYSSPLLDTFDAATAAAQSRLADSLGARVGITMTGRFHPGQEVGDVVLVEESPGQFRPHLIDTIAWNSGRATVSIATRATGPQSTGVAS